MAPEVTTPLEEALAAVERTLPSARPFSYRIESAGNEAIGAVIDLYGIELGSRSEAIRDLLARGARSLAAERA